MIRHGPMVLRVCRSVLCLTLYDAEDAFKLSFLVLAHRASSIRRAWVHRKLAIWCGVPSGDARQEQRRSPSRSRHASRDTDYGKLPAG